MAHAEPAMKTKSTKRDLSSRGHACCYASFPRENAVAGMGAVDQWHLHPSCECETMRISPICVKSIKLIDLQFLLDFSNLNLALRLSLEGMAIGHAKLRIQTAP
jgi:hypothetical protein